MAKIRGIKAEVFMPIHSKSTDFSLLMIMISTVVDS